MEVFDERDAILVRYLLNELSKAENEEIEDEMVLDPEFSERVQAVETSLIESYLLGEMSAAEQTRFEKGYFIFPENREKVEDARAFYEALRMRRRDGPAATPMTPAPARPGWLASLLRLPAPALAFAALVLIAAVVTVIFLFGRRGSNEVVSGNRNGQEKSREQVVSPTNVNREENSNQNKPEESVNAQTKNATNESLPSNQEVSNLDTVRPSRVVISIKENKGRVDASPMGSGDEVKVQSVRVPVSAKSFTLRVSLEHDEYFEESLDCSVDISNRKFAHLYPAADYMKVKARPVAGKFQVSINIPTAYLKDGELYYFRVKEINSHTPFRVTFAK